MKKIKTLKIAIYSLLSICILFIFIGFIYLKISDMESNKIKEDMLSQGQTVNIVFDETYIESLPSPVQKYFAFTFKDKKSFSLKAVSWEEQGFFSIPKLGVFSMNSWQVSLMNDVHYLWRGYMKQFFGLLTIESRDYFAFNKHDMRAKIWGIKKIMNSDYTKEEELSSLYEYLTLRYYGTALNFPWLLFSNENILWKPLDKSSSYLIVKTKNSSAKFIVSFKEDGRIWKMETLNYNLHGNHESLNEISLKDEYVDWKGVMVPTKIKYIWKDINKNITSYEFRINNLKKLF